VDSTKWILEFLQLLIVYFGGKYFPKVIFNTEALQIKFKLHLIAINGWKLEILKAYFFKHARLLWSIYILHYNDQFDSAFTLSMN